MRDAHEFLSTCPWLADTPPDAVQGLAAHASWRDYRAGDAVYRCGNRPAGVFGVAAGQFKIVVASAHGRDAVSTVVPAGEWFGEAFLLADIPYFADCLALDKGRALFLPRAALADFCAQWPVVYRRLNEVICRKSLLIVRMAVQYKVGDPEMRLAHRLVMAMEETPRDAGAEWVTLRERLSHELLAQMLGLSRPRVTLAVQALTEAGVLIARRGLVQVHAARLQRYCSDADIQQRRN